MRPACPAHQQQPRASSQPSATSGVAFLLSAVARRALLAGRLPHSAAARMGNPASSSFAASYARGNSEPAADADATGAPRANASKPRLLPVPGAPKVIILAGPTAVGKTAVSLALGAALAQGGPPGSGLGPIEIINADSVQVYKGLDVGSDKVKEEEERRRDGE
jgi:hypothetical protein